MIHITPPAVEKLKALIEEHPEDPIVRLAVRDRDDKVLVFSITLEDAVTQEDSVLDIEGLIIAIDGSIAELNVVSGHPMLIPAALNAVQQWVYRPTVLNGKPVPVDTQIEVNFTLGR